MLEPDDFVICNVCKRQVGRDEITSTGCIICDELKADDREGNIDENDYPEMD